MRTRRGYWDHAPGYPPAPFVQWQDTDLVCRERSFDPIKEHQFRGSVTRGARDAGCNPAADRRAVRLSLSPPPGVSSKGRKSGRLPLNRGSIPLAPTSFGGIAQRKSSRLLTDRSRFEPLCPYQNSGVSSNGKRADCRSANRSSILRTPASFLAHVPMDRRPAS
jgi:hypothetical protein